MKALTMTQPWATLVAIGAKRIETRSWKPKRHPGEEAIAIHAAKKMPPAAADLCGEEPFRSALEDAGYIGPEMLPRSRVLAVVRFGVAERTEKARLALSGHFNPEGNRELSFGDYSDGRWAWHFSQVVRLTNPVPAGGALGLWTPDEELEAEIEAQVRTSGPFYPD